MELKESGAMAVDEDDARYEDTVEQTGSWKSLDISFWTRTILRVPSF